MIVASKYLLRSLIATTAIFVVGCSTPVEKNKSDRSRRDSMIASKNDSVLNGQDEGISEPVEITDSKMMQILSFTDTLYKGDTLKIKFKVPHSKDLAIKTPDDRFFFLVYFGNDKQKPSLVDWDKFANMPQLDIVTDKTKASWWDVSAKENQLIFTKTGKYEMLLSDNLETDDGTPVETKRIFYYDVPRK